MARIVRGSSGAVVHKSCWVVALAVLCAGCASKLDNNVVRNIHRVSIEPTANPDGFSSPYDLKMFVGGSPPGSLLNPVNAFAKGVAEGVDKRVTQGALASTDDILKAKNVKLGDDATRSMAEKLRAGGYEVVSENADARLTIVLERVGYVCDGFFLEGACKPRIDAKFRLDDARTGRRIFDTICNLGIQSSILACSMESDPSLGFARASDVLSNPERAGANLLEATRALTTHVATELAHPAVATGPVAIAPSRTQ